MSEIPLVNKIPEDVLMATFGNWMVRIRGVIDSHGAYDKEGNPEKTCF
jgi:hypothetical protein